MNVHVIININVDVIMIVDSKLAINIEMNINMHINIESDCRDALPAGALPPNPHAFGGTGFFQMPRHHH